MPLISVKVIEGVFTPAQKQDIVRKLTDAMVGIEGREHAPRDLVRRRGGSQRAGIAGNPLRTEDVKALAAGVPTH